MDQLTLLRSFVAVHRAGSITGAARGLRLTQPAVTQHVQALEQLVGRELFRRSARGVEPTRAGRELAQAATTHIDALEEILGRRRAGGALAETVVLGGPEEFMISRVLPLVHADMTARDLHVRTRFGMVDRLVPMLMAGEIDLLIATADVPRRGIEYRALCLEEHALVAAPRWKESLSPAGMRSDPAGTLVAVPMVAFDEELPLIREFWRDVFDASPLGRAKMVADGLRAIVQMVVDGVGMTVLPRHVCEVYLQDGSLVELARPSQPTGISLYLAWRGGSLARPQLARIHQAILDESVRW